MKRIHLLFASAMLCSAACIAMPVKAAPLTNDLLRSPSERAVEAKALSPSLLLPKVECAAAETVAVCDVRRAAARRALEVMVEEQVHAASATVSQPKITPISIVSGAFASTDVVVPADGKPVSLRTVSPQSTHSQPMSLLIPVGLIPIAQNPQCDPSLTAEQCARLNPGGSLEPIPPTPPVVPPPPVVPEAPSPGQPTVPGPEVDPVPVAPPSVIPPPRTGDDELVRRPPVTGSNMPVIKPKIAPPPISAN